VIDTLLALIPVYGVTLVFTSVALGCFGVPAPATVSLVVAGAFVEAGQVPLVPVVAAGLLGAATGAQAGYWVGVRGGGWAARRGVARARSFARAREWIARWGAAGVFLSQWLMSPLGPPINVASGMLGMPWGRFTVWCAIGQAIWVGLFVGLGYAFSHSLPLIVDLSRSLGLVLVFGVAAAAAAYLLRRRLAYARVRD
jgi:membrane-associated protein